MATVFAIIDAPIIFVIGAVVVLLFGAERLPKLARAMGQAKKEFDTSIHQPSAGTSRPPQTGVQPPSDADGPRPVSEPSQTVSGSQSPRDP